MVRVSTVEKDYDEDNHLKIMISEIEVPRSQRSEIWQRVFPPKHKSIRGPLHTYEQRLRESMVLYCWGLYKQDVVIVAKKLHLKIPLINAILKRNPGFSLRELQMDPKVQEQATIQYMELSDQSHESTMALQKKMWEISHKAADRILEQLEDNVMNPIQLIKLLSTSTSAGMKFAELTVDERLTKEQTLMSDAELTRRVETQTKLLAKTKESKIEDAEVVGVEPITGSATGNGDSPEGAAS